MITALERITPEAAGVPSGDVRALLEALIRSGSEMHGMMILRYGKVIAEGYWSPYASGQVHGSQSLTKTMTGAAFGAAMQEGLIDLDTRLIDIFPEYAPLCAGKPYWDELRMRHMTTMAAGMEKQPPVTDRDWIREFFTMDIIHKPGDAFYYNSAACSMVGASIRRITGLGLRAFLKERVLDVIGIDAEHLKWHCHPDGMENGSGGLVSSTEDNARLMELYRRKGVWNGKRILSEKWVEFALKTENAHLDPPTSYCGMMWKHGDCLMADGAMGQWSMYYPEKELIVSLSQTISKPAQGGKVTDAVNAFAHGLGISLLAENKTAAEELNYTLRRLSLPAPLCRENPELMKRLDGKHIEILDGSVVFFADDLCIFNPSYAIPVRGLAFRSFNGDLMLKVKTDGGEHEFAVGMKGRRLLTTAITVNPAATAALCGEMPDGNTLEMEIRWLESCRIHRLSFAFGDDMVTIISSMDKVGGFDVEDSAAHGKLMGGTNA
jgi:CubicO group peptidase (beta-lactamase class C family)